MDRDLYVAEKMFETLIMLNVFESEFVINRAMQPDLRPCDRDFVKFDTYDVESFRDMVHASFENKSGADMFLSLGYKIITQQPFGEDSAFIGTVLTEYEARRHGLNIDKEVFRDLVESCVKGPSDETEFINMVHTLSQDKELALNCR